MLENSRFRPECNNNYMTPHLDRIIELFEKLEKKASADYFSLFTKAELSKGEFLLRQGAVSQYIWFLEEGIGRLFVVNDKGIEITGDFFFPCEFVDSYCSSSIGIPSNVNIQLIQDSLVYSVNWGSLEFIRRKYPIILEIEKLLVGCHISWLEDRLYRIRSSAAQERYLYLLNRQPQLVQYIPLTYIASYLGISLETLSRIRAKLKI